MTAECEPGTHQSYSLSHSPIAHNRDDGDGIGAGGRQSQRSSQATGRPRAINLTLDMTEGRDDADAIADQIRRMVSANSDAYAELDRLTSQTRVEGLVNQQLTILISDQRRKYEAESQLCKQLAAKLKYWQDENGKLESARQVLSERMRKLKDNVESSPNRPVPRLKLRSPPLTPTSSPSRASALDNISLAPTSLMRRMLAKKQSKISETSQENVFPSSPRNYPASDAIFDEFTVIGSNLSCITKTIGDKAVKAWTDSPSVLFKYPFDYSDSSLKQDNLIAFACPSGKVDIVRYSSLESSSSLSLLRFGQDQFRKGSNCHIFQHKRDSENSTAIDMFGICLRTQELTTVVDPRSGESTDLLLDISFCIISRYPFFTLHFSVIERVLAARRLHLHTSQAVNFIGPNLSRSLVDVFYNNVSGCISVLEGAYSSSLPGPGMELKVSCPYELPSISFTRPCVSDYSCIVDWCCSLTFSVSSPDTLIMLLDIVLREFTLVVAGTNLALTSAAAITMQSLMQPLQWTGVFIPLLPDDMRDFLQSPVPLIAGVRELPSHITSGEDLEDNVAVWLPEQNEVWVPRRFHGKMPRTDELVQTLLPLLGSLQMDKQIIYQCTPDQQESISNIMVLFRKYVERLVQDASSDDCIDQSSIFLNALRDTQMMSQYKSNKLRSSHY